MYRNYDGNGATFGDTSISATTLGRRELGVRQRSSSDPTDIVMVAINKTTSTEIASLDNITHPTQLTAADVYTLTSASPAR